MCRSFEFYLTSEDPGLGVNKVSGRHVRKEGKREREEILPTQIPRVEDHSQTFTTNHPPHPSTKHPKQGTTEESWTLLRTVHRSRVLSHFRLPLSRCSRRKSRGHRDY